MVQVEVFQGPTRLYAGPAQQVVLPGADGELAVLDWHAPALCVLAAGLVEVDERRFRIGGGLACIGRNRVLVIGRERWNFSA